MRKEHGGDAVLVALYEWAREEFATELREGLPGLRGFPGVGAKVFVEAFCKTDPQSRPALVCALLRRVHRTASARLGEVDSEETLAILKRFDWLFAHELALASRKRTSHHTPLVRTPRVRRLKALIKERLSGVAGPVIEEDATEWVQSTRIGPFFFETHFDTGGARQLVYDHRLRDAWGGNLLDGQVSFLSLLGVSAAMDLLLPEEGERAANLLYKMVTKVKAVVAEAIDRQG